MISRKSVLLISMCLAAASGIARAQWKVVAPNSLVPDKSFGAMYFKDGILWAGWSILLRSTDSGRTWTNINFPGEEINDISFANKNTGIITTKDGAFLTQDQGQTWTALPTILNLASRVAFGPSPHVAYALVWWSSVLFRSLDGGMNWQSLPTNSSQEMTFTITSNGKLCLVSGTINSGTVSLSADSGSSWHQTPAHVGQDCWTILSDPGDVDRFYLTEEHPSSPAPVHLYASNDDGNTWHIGYTNVDVAGSLSVSSCAAFAGTEKNGVLRSTDFGASWQKIGGPNGVNDNRMVCAINANIVFAVDSFGSIWGTYNGGGDSVAQPINGTLSISPSALFDTVSCSDSMSNTLHVIHDGCLPPAIQKCSIIGNDSSSYRITGTDFDSLNILFHPIHPGTSNATMVLSLNDGSTDTIPLIGWNSVESNIFSFTPNQLFFDDTLSCDSATNAVTIYTASGCTPPQVTQYSIAGADSACYRISRMNNDSIDVLFSPNHNGEHQAELLLALSNGKTDSILLGGNGLIDLPLRLTTSDEATNIIGGDVSVPITISGLIKPEDIDLTMHYEGNAHYNGSFDRNGTSLDVPGSSWPGRAKLDLKNVMPGSIAGYSLFTVYTDSAKPFVTFDSISVLSASRCEYSSALAVTSSITSPSGCGTPILSEALEGKALVFRIRPNPTRGDVFLESPMNVDSAVVDIFDALGIERERMTMSFTKGHSMPISFPMNPGIYYLRVTTQSGIFSTNVILTR